MHTLEKLIANFGFPPWKHLDQYQDNFASPFLILHHTYNELYLS